MTLLIHLSDVYNLCYPTRSGAYLRELLTNQTQIDEAVNSMVDIDFEGMRFIITGIVSFSL